MRAFLSASLSGNQSIWLPVRLSIGLATWLPVVRPVWAAEPEEQGLASSSGRAARGLGLRTSFGALTASGAAHQKRHR